MKLSEHFSLSEFTRSEKAKALGVRNEPSILQIHHLSLLCTKVLEPLRVHFDKPVIITSGFRSAALNEAVGGSKTSQHLKGEAADINIKGIAMADIWQYIKDNLEFDQVIAEKISRKNPQAGWIHVSYRAGHNRKEAKSYIGNGKYPYGLHYID